MRSTARTMKLGPQRLQYLVHPPKAPSEGPLPLMLFLHGAGERGDDLAMVAAHGIPKLVEAGRDFPFVSVSPQCPAESWWSEPEMVAALSGLLDEVQEDFGTDPTRLYVTGLSMGGFGTWALMAAFPHRIAAAAPVCGGLNPTLAGSMTRVPVWAFHGEADTVVPVSHSAEMVSAVKALGGDAKLTTYPGVGHDSWTQTYENEAIYDWFLSHALRP